MPGPTKREDVKKSLRIDEVPKTALGQFTAGKYWKSWTKKDKTADPKSWRRHKKQRIKYGYSTFDWWSFDSYIAGVIAHACEKFSTSSAGHPGDMTYDEWKEYCHSISVPLALWASPDRWKMGYKDEMELYSQAQEALRKFAQRFGSFWD